MARTLQQTAPEACRVCILAVPEAVISTLSGLYDVMNAMASLKLPGDSGQAIRAFEVEIVGERTGPLMLASGIPIVIQRSVDDVVGADIVLVPSFLLGAGGWQTGRYPALLAWLKRMHQGGAVLCSACSGIFLLAETGLFDGREATVHFAYAALFGTIFPAVAINPARVLVISGAREELVCSGASTTWHDLALHLIVRFAGAAAAQEVARMYALQWHQEGLTPYIIFEGKRDHGDAEIAGAQQWLEKHFSVASPVQQLIGLSNMAERTFKRRFTSATGLTPIDYVQRLRIEDAKRRLERSEAAVDEISWLVGYEDPAFFRRLFRRTTGLAPGAYRTKFSIPAFAQLAPPAS